MSKRASNEAPVWQYHDPALHAHLFTRRSVFLSASVVQEGREHEAQAAPGDPNLVREAVVSTAREVLLRGWNLVFGGHPMISPMLLVLAKEFQGANHGRIVCFQSELFLGRIPQATITLWNHGSVLMTRMVTGSDGKETLQRSLSEMRERMLGIPNLVAGVFIGGMIGVLDEAKLLQDKRLPNVTFYAFPGTGSAAHDLFTRDSALFSGGSPKLEALMRKSGGQAIVAKRVVEQIEFHVRRLP